MDDGMGIAISILVIVALFIILPVFILLTEKSSRPLESNDKEDKKTSNQEEKKQDLPIKELNLSEPIKYVGAIVYYEKYGYGAGHIISIDDKFVTIKFVPKNKEPFISKFTIDSLNNTIKIIKTDETPNNFDGITNDNEEKTSRPEPSVKQNDNNKKIIETKEIIMTNAEFLNRNFGTNYVKWMKCTWQHPYYHKLKVWMIEFDGNVRYGWKNTVLNNSIVERFVEPLSHQIPAHRSFSETYRLVVDKSRNYKILGVYKYDRINSDLRTKRIWIKVADSLNNFKQE